MPRNIAAIVFFSLIACSTAALAEKPNALNGTWILDAKSTETQVLISPRPENAKKIADWFIWASGYSVIYRYDFKDDSVIVGPILGYSHGDNKTEYQLVSQQGTEMRYAIKADASLPVKTMLVSTLSDGSIKISHSGSSEYPYFPYLVYKRAQEKEINEVNAYAELEMRLKTWTASIINIVHHLDPNRPLK